jgi:hypothetical protein
VRRPARGQSGGHAGADGQFVGGVPGPGRQDFQVVGEISPRLDQVYAIGPVAAQRREHEFFLDVGMVGRGQPALLPAHPVRLAPAGDIGLRRRQ